MSVARLPSPVSEGRSLSSQGSTAVYWLWALFWLLMITVSIGEQLRNPDTLWWEPILWEGSSALVTTCWLLIAIVEELP